MARRSTSRKRPNRAARRLRPLRGEVLERRYALAGTASISGAAWDDLNGSGARDAGEPGRSGAIVYLDLNDNRTREQGEPFATTAADGGYTLSNLDAGSFALREEAPANYRVSFPQVSGRRLFAVDTATNPDRIVELNPATGAVLQSFNSPVNGSSSSGLAFDGQRLYFLSDSNDTLYELSPTNGAVLDSTVLASSIYGSLATLNGNVYVLKRFDDDVVIFNPATNTVTGTTDLDAVNDGLSLADVLGESAANGELIGVDAGNGYVGFFNSATGVRTGSFGVADGIDVESAQAIGGEVFVGYTNRIDVHSRVTGGVLRSMMLTFTPHALAGTGDVSGAHRVTLTDGQNTANQDFGNQIAVGNIQGVKWQDANSNGSREGNEALMAGKLIYLDVNDNGARDTGEPATITGADGSYSFANLAPGAYAVREVVPGGFQQTFPAFTQNRLFVLSGGTIHELNPQTEEKLGSFAAPFSGQIFNGLAFDGRTIYYLNDSNGILYEINPDSGVVVDSTTLPANSYEGLAAIGGLVYVGHIFDGKVSVFNPATNAIVRTITVTGFPDAYIYDGLGELSSPNRLLARGLFDELLVIDPNTGAASVTFGLQVSNPYGLTSVGQEIFAGNSSGRIDVYSTTGALLRTFTGAPAAFSLGGAAGNYGAQRVTVVAGQTAAGVDFGSTEPLAAPEPIDVSLDGSGNLLISDLVSGGKSDNIQISLSGTTYTIKDTSTPVANAFSVSGVANVTGSGTSTITIPAASITGTQIIVNGAGGNDTLTIDLSTGDAIPTGGIRFDGGNPTTGPGDKLVITGGNQGTVTYNYTNAHDGSVVMSNFGTVNYTGLEPITNSGTATNVVFNLPTIPATTTMALLSDDGMQGNGMSRLSGLTFETTDFANPLGSVTINRGSALDTVTVQTVPDFNAGLNIGSAANPFQNVTFAGALIMANDKSVAATASGTISLPGAPGNIAAAGTGSISLTSARDISLGAGSILSVVNGDLTLSANQQLTPTNGNFSGVAVIGGNVRSAGSGNVTVVGRGGDSNSGSQFGVRVFGGGLISGGTSGSLNVTGFGGTSTGNSNSGVSVTSANSRITSGGGDVAVSGSGGGGASFNRGVVVDSGGQIAAGGAGDVLVQGMAGAGTLNINQGVVAEGADSGISSNSGNVTIVGTGGGTGTTIFNGGVVTLTGGFLRAGGSGSLRVTGTAGNPGGVSNGISISPNTTASTEGGDITLIGIPVNTSAPGVLIDGSVTPGPGGNVFLVADRVNISSVGSITATGQSVSIRPMTPGTAIELGGPDTPTVLGITDAELDRISAGGIQIGDEESGDITVSSDISREEPSSISLISGGSINFVNGSVQSGGNAAVVLSPGDSASASFAHSGTDVSTGDFGTLSFAAGSDLAIAIQGTAVDTQYQQLNVAGQVVLTGVDLVLTGTYLPALGDTFVLVNNDGTDAIIGEFNGLPEGSTFNPGNGGLITEFQITYEGGDGNDVVLTALNTATLRGTDGDDDWNASLNQGNIEVTLNGAVAFSAPAENVAGLTIEGLEGSDTLTVDLSSGDAVPDASGITFHGGDQIFGAGDKLVITGGDQGTVTYNYVNVNDGSIVMTNFGTVTYTGLEPITNSGTPSDVIINLPAGPNVVTFGDDGTSGNGMSRLSGATFETTDFANPTGTLTINRGDPADTITLNALPDFSAGLTIASQAKPFADVTFAGALTLAANKSLTATASGTIELSDSTSDLTTTGSGAVSLTAETNIRLLTGSSISTVDGGITLIANQGATPSAGNSSGVLVRTSILTTGGAGDITLVGRGTTATDAAGHNGINIGEGLIQSLASGSNAGRILISGVGADGTTDNKGVVVGTQNGLSSQIVSHSGDIEIIGTAGNGTADFNRGVFIAGGSVVTSTGVGAEAANIIIQGTGGSGTDFNEGVDVNGVISAIDGHISITGQASTATIGQFNLGIRVRDGSQISTISSGGTGGSISLIGIGGGGTITNQGVRLEDAGAKVRSVDGHISITGTATASSGTFQDGVRIVDGAGIEITGIGSLTVTGAAGTTVSSVGVGLRLGSNSPSLIVSGPTTLAGDRIIFDLANFSLVAGTSVVTLRPVTPGIAINLGSTINNAVATLELSDAELDLISSAGLQIGGANSGAITLSADISRAPATSVTLASGSSINFTNGSMNTGGGELLLSSGIGGILVARTGNDITTSPANALNFADGSDLVIAINGPIADTQYQQLNVIGQVNLTGAGLVLSGTYAPTVNDSIILVANDDSDAITGIFDSLPESSFVNVNGALLRITYHGGDGNDVALIPPNLPPSFTKGPDQTGPEINDEAGAIVVPN